MKIKTLNEAISLTKEKHTILNALVDMGELTLGDIQLFDMEGQHLTIYSHYNTKITNGSNYRRVHSILMDLTDSVTKHIQGSISDVMSNIANSEVKVFLSKLNGAIGGSAGYDYVNLNVDTTTLEKDTESFLMNVLLDAGVFSEDEHDVHTLVINNIEEVYHILSSMKIRNFKVWNELPNIIGTKIHELVHIIQHSKQPEMGVKGFGTEYRSNLTDQERFYQAVRNVSSGDATEEDTRIYYSSIQEIPAHAHNVALDIISKIEFPESGKIDKWGEGSIRRCVSRLTTLLQNLNTTNFNDYKSPYYGSWRLKYYDQTFNKPDEPKLYAVYKRFIKIVYQELYNYIKYWTDQLSKQTKQYKYNILLNGEVIDSIFYGWLDKKKMEDVRQGLVGHDGYDENIQVVRAR